MCAVLPRKTLLFIIHASTNKNESACGSRKTYTFYESRDNDLVKICEDRIPELADSIFNLRLSTIYFICHSNGHVRCGRRRAEGGLSKICYYEVVDGTTCIPDTAMCLDYCEHKRLRQQCVPCGGIRMCEHAIQKSKCQLCKPSASGVIGRKKKHHLTRSHFYP